ncbi:putative pyridoxal phosphate-dependent enzyme [Planctomycetales bacterium 10988]|nr:putative pyridoxal phosphate-dependent enzyme [Planctomycetales bacterium 10988]
MSDQPVRTTNSHPENASAIEAPVPLIDIHEQYLELAEEIREAIGRVCDSGRFVLGPDVEELEASIADYCDAKYALGCGSGSDALILALLALEIGSGDEVILPSYTFFATAGAVWQVGATPVFCDIDPDTYLMDAESVAAKVTSKTKAIIPVHLYGQCVEMEPLWRLASEHHIAIIEDAAQAIGAEYRGRRAGVLGDIACFSFYPTKNLGGFGDGGMITTDDPILAERLRLLRVHGMKPRYYHKIVGINSRLDSIQAAVLNIKMPHLERWTRMRLTNAMRYQSLFFECGLDQILKLPEVAPDRRHVWNQYIVAVPDGKRDALRAHLAKHKIGSEIYYPVPVHKQECFNDLETAQVDLPITDEAALSTIALPIFPELKPVQQWQVVSAIAEFFQVKAPTKPAVPETLKGPNFLKFPTRAISDKKTF